MLQATIGSLNDPNIKKNITAVLDCLEVALEFCSDKNDTKIRTSVENTKKSIEKILLMTSPRVVFIAWAKMWCCSEELNRKPANFDRVCEMLRDTSEMFSSMLQKI